MLDLPAVTEVAEELISNDGLSGRVKVMAGDADTLLVDLHYLLQVALRRIRLSPDAAPVKAGAACVWVLVGYVSPRWHHVGVSTPPERFRVSLGLSLLCGSPADGFALLVLLRASTKRPAPALRGPCRILGDAMAAEPLSRMTTASDGTGIFLRVPESRSRLSSHERGLPD